MGSARAPSRRTTSVSCSTTAASTRPTTCWTRSWPGCSQLSVSAGASHSLPMPASAPSSTSPSRSATSPPDITMDGTVGPIPSLHTRRPNADTSVCYVPTAITQAMCMGLSNVGARDLAATLDRAGQPLDGATTYRLLPPPASPAAALWSVTVYDRQRRSRLRTPHRFPRAGSQRYPTPSRMVRRSSASALASATASRTAPGSRRIQSSAGSCSFGSTPPSRRSSTRPARRRTRSRRRTLTRAAASQIRDRIAIEDRAATRYVLACAWTASPSCVVVTAMSSCPIQRGGRSCRVRAPAGDVPLLAPGTG